MSVLFSEAIKLKDGVFYNLEYHQKRVDETLQQFFRTTLSLSVLNKAIPENKATGLYKCRVVYGDKINSVEFIPYNFRKIEKVGIVIDNHIEYNYKYVDRNCLNRLLEKSNCDDIIIIKDNFVTDSFSANLVFRSASGFYTPEDCLLRGTKRQHLIKRGIIREKKIHIEDIKEYDRIFFINAMIDLEDNISVETSSLLHTK